MLNKIADRIFRFSFKIRHYLGSILGSQGEKGGGLFSFGLFANRGINVLLLTWKCKSNSRRKREDSSYQDPLELLSK